MPKLAGNDTPKSVLAHTRSSALRKALIASVAFGFLAGLVGSANARYLDRDRYEYYYRYDDIPRVKRAVSKKQEADKPEKKDPFAEAKKGELQLVVSISNQHVTLYSNGNRVAQGPVSTGVPGHLTPMGVFSIIEKDRYHHSNLYSNAPMPYMNRITWSGVALHEGPLPGGPASHGCIRLSHEFASHLWTVTKLGVRVVVARNDVVPVDFSHPSLFQPKPKVVEPPPIAAQAPDKEAERAATVQVAVAGSSPDAGVPLGGVELRKSLSDTATSSSTKTENTGTAAVSPGTGDESPKAEPPKADPETPAEELLPAQPPLPKPSPVRAKAKPTGHVAVFISRKEKKLYVRQGFTPLFDIPVEIANPDLPLGTHVFTALELQDDGAKMRWNAITMPGDPPRPAPGKDKKSSRERAKPPVVVEVLPPQTAAQALDRIQIPQEAIDRIDEILVPGSSLVISDQGLGQETGKGTDFVVVTR